MAKSTVSSACGEPDGASEKGTSAENRICCSGMVPPRIEPVNVPVAVAVMVPAAKATVTELRATATELCNDGKLTCWVTAWNDDAQACTAAGGRST